MKRDEEEAEDRQEKNKYDPPNYMKKKKFNSFFFFLSVLLNSVESFSLPLPLLCWSFSVSYLCIVCNWCELWYSIVTAETSFDIVVVRLLKFRRNFNLLIGHEFHVISSFLPSHSFPFGWQSRLSLSWPLCFTSFSLLIFIVIDWIRKHVTILHLIIEINALIYVK